MTQHVIVRPNEALIQWIKDRLPPEFGYVDFVPAETQCSVLLSDDGQPLVVVALDGFSDHSCDLTIVSDGSKRWGTPAFITATYEYIFVTRGLNRLSMIVAAQNEPAVKLHRMFGHVQEGVHRDYFGPGRDAFSFSLLKSDYLKGRWHKRAKRRES